MSAGHSTRALPGGPSTCTLCGAGGPRPWPTCELCTRCYRDLIAGLNRRYEAALRLGALGDGPADPWTDVTLLPDEGAA